MDLNNFIKGVYLNHDDFTFDQTNKYVRVAVASETKKGLVKFATAAERTAGASGVAVTPADVNQIIADANITVQDASALQAGIVNLTTMQELGAGDKAINGVRIGQGPNGNWSTTAVGWMALNSNVSGVNNTALGTSTLHSNSGGSHNTAVGLNALGENTYGSNNTAVGAGASYDQTDEDGTTSIGAFAQARFSNSTAIGFNSATTRNNQVVLGNTDVEMVETSGWMGGKGIVTTSTRTANTTNTPLDLSVADFFFTSGSQLATSPTNLPFKNNSTGSDALVSFTVEVVNAASFTSWFAGITWKGGQVPTPIDEGLYSFYTIDNGLTWTGIDLNAAGGGSVSDASATQAGIVNLLDGQVLGSGAKVIDGVTVSGSSVTGTGARVHVTENVAIGINAVVTDPGSSGNGGIAIGINSSSEAYSIAIGTAASATSGSGSGSGGGAVAIGYGAQVSTSYSGVINSGGVAIGQGAKIGIGATYGDGSVAIGNNAEAGKSPDAIIGGLASTAVGAGAQAGNTVIGSGYAGQATALGYGANAQGQNSTAIGFEATTTKDYQVVLGNTATETVETYGRYGSKGQVTNAVIGATTIDLSQGEYFVVSGSALATTPINVPSYAFETDGSVTFFIVEVNDVTTFTGWWPGIQWDNGIEPTLSAPGTGADLFGFICLKPPSGSTLAPFWKGITLAKALSTA